MPKTLQIPVLGTDKKMLIDEDDLLLILKYAWRLKQDKRTGVHYIAASVREGNRIRTVRVHRLLANPQRGEDVHHINHDPYDNRRVNLANIPAEQHRLWHNRARRVTCLKK